MLVLLVTALLFALLAIGAPVGFALLAAGSVGLYLFGGPSLFTGILSTAPLSSVTTYEMITVPLFILMAEFVILSGVADRLFRAGTVWVGRTPGGLGVATALAGAGFGAISGSSTASAAALSSTTIPAMLRAGYNPRMACGVVAISGTLAMLIPPSIAIVLYGIIADVSIGRLLIAGIIPGILVTMTIVATILALVAWDPQSAPRGQRYPWIEKLRVLKVVAPMLFLFMAVTGVIYLGVATPTEASALGALGALLLTALERKLTVSLLFKALSGAAEATCMILMIIMGAQVFGYFFTITQTTQTIVDSVLALGLPAWGILAMILLMYLLLGCIMDQIAILILTIPVVLPVITGLGYDPVWFGIIVIVTAEVGLLTPPVGMNVFVVSRYAKQPLADAFAGTTPHVAAHLLLIWALAAFPQLVMWLPSTMKGG